MHRGAFGDSEIGFKKERCVEGSSEVDPFAVVMNDVAISLSRAVVFIFGGSVRFQNDTHWDTHY